MKKDIRVANENDRRTLTQEEKDEAIDLRGMSVFCAATMCSGASVPASVVIENAEIFLHYIMTGEKVQDGS